MIAKLVTHAKTRERGDRGAGRCARRLHHRGHSPQHSVSVGDHAASALARRQAFDRLSSPRNFPKGLSARRRPARSRTIAGVAAAIDHVLGERKRQISGQLNARSRASAGARSGSAARILVDVEREGDAIAVVFEDGAIGTFCPRTGLPGARYGQGTVDGAPVGVHVPHDPNGFELAYRGIEVKAFVYTEREARYARLMPVKKLSDSGKAVRCPMPGLVVSLAVAEGQEVKAGETLAVVEAMKMENILRAERDGTIKKIRVKPGDSVAVDAVIMEFA
jgi:propionyl-CoA carboxylase alpha chain